MTKLRVKELCVTQLCVKVVCERVICVCVCDKVVSVKELHVCVFVTKLIVVCVTKLCVKEGCGVDGGGGRTERTGVHRKTITPHKDVQNYKSKLRSQAHQFVS